MAESCFRRILGLFERFFTSPSPFSLHKIILAFPAIRGHLSAASLATGPLI